MPSLIDLTDDARMTTALLADPHAWRVRVVEQIDVDSPNGALRRRSLQCAPLRPLLTRAGALPKRADATEALVVQSGGAFKGVRREG